MRIGETQEYLGWTIEMYGHNDFMAYVPQGKAIEECDEKYGSGLHCLACYGAGIRVMKADIRDHNDLLADCPNCHQEYPHI
jgi:hypothetical protein